MRKCAAVLLFCCFSGYAATLLVSPLSLDIDLRRSKAGSTTLSNTGTAPARYQVSVFRVVQDGQETLQPAPEIIVNPAVFTVEAGKKQVLRAGLAGAAPTLPETAYRLRVQQQPIPGADKSISTLLSVGVPLYVHTADGGAQVSFALEKSGDDLRLLARNTGTRRAVLANLTVQSSSGQAGLGGLVLVAGGTLRFALKGVGETGASVSYQDSAGAQHAEPLAPPH